MQLVFFLKYKLDPHVPFVRQPSGEDALDFVIYAREKARAIKWAQLALPQEA